MPAKKTTKKAPARRTARKTPPERPDAWTTRVVPRIRSGEIVCFDVQGMRPSGRSSRGSISTYYPRLPAVLVQECETSRDVAEFMAQFENGDAYESNTYTLTARSGLGVGDYTKDSDDRKIQVGVVVGTGVPPRPAPEPEPEPEGHPDPEVQDIANRIDRTRAFADLMRTEREVRAMMGGESEGDPFERTLSMMEKLEKIRGGGNGGADPMMMMLLMRSMQPPERDTSGDLMRAFTEIMQNERKAAAESESRRREQEQSLFLAQMKGVLDMQGEVMQKAITAAMSMGGGETDMLTRIAGMAENILPRVLPAAPGMPPNTGPASSPSVGGPPVPAGSAQPMPGGVAAGRPTLPPEAIFVRKVLQAAHHRPDPDVWWEREGEPTFGMCAEPWRNELLERIKRADAQAILEVLAKTDPPAYQQLQQMYVAEPKVLNWIQEVLNAMHEHFFGESDDDETDETSDARPEADAPARAPEGEAVPRG